MTQSETRKKMTSLHGYSSTYVNCW